MDKEKHGLEVAEQQRKQRQEKREMSEKNQRAVLHLPFEITSVLKNNLFNFFHSLKLYEQLYCFNSR